MSVAEGEEEELEGEPTRLGDFAVQSGDSVVYQYPIGSLVPSEGSPSISAILVGVLDAGALFCFPHFAWHRKAQHRLLPPGSFKKPVRVVVPGCLAGDMEQASDTSITVWLGYLESSPATQVEFSEETQADRGFGTDGMPDLLPHALGIVSAAEERFNFHSAGSGSAGLAAHPALEAGVPEARLKRLEDSFKDVQKSLASLTEMLAAPKAPERSKDSRAVTSGRLQDLDPAVVASARATGIPDQHLPEMAKILGKGPGKLEDCPRPRTKAATKDPLSESSSEESVEEAEGATSADAQVAKAVGQLTKVVKVLAAEKVKSQAKNPLEQLLDGASSSSTGDPSSAGRKNAAVLRALKRALQENPSYIYRNIEENLQTDFQSRAVGPGDGGHPGSVRGWLEHRSRISHAGQARWAWQVGGIWQCIIDNRIEEARARCAVLVAAADQSAVDGGRQTALLEAPCPFSSFHAHRPPGPGELHHSVLLDNRWIETYLAHIKEIDTFQEAKKRLSGRQVQAQDDPPGRPPADDARGGKGREGKGAKGEKGDGRKKEGEASSGNNAAK